MHATAQHEERTTTLCSSAISCLSLQILTYKTCLQIATGAERGPHGRAKVTYDCESET